MFKNFYDRIRPWIKLTLMRSFRKIVYIVSHPIRNLVIIGLVIRFILALYASNTNDVFPTWRASMDMLAGHSPYASASYAYPPLWPYTMFIFIKPLSLIFDPSKFAVHISEIGKIESATYIVSNIVTSPMFNFAFKLPLILTDLLTGLAIYDIIKEVADIEKARKAFMLWFFNPLVIWAGSAMGQFDVMLVYFMLISCYLIYKGKFFYAGVASALSILYKTYSIYVILFYALYSFAEHLHGHGEKPDRRIYSLLSVTWQAAKNPLKFLMGIIATSLPFFFFICINPWTSWMFFHRTEVWGVGTETFLVGGLNLWFIKGIPHFEGIVYWAMENRTFLGLLFPSLGVISAIIIALLVFLIKNSRLKRLIYGTIGILAVTLLTIPTTNPQHLISLIPFLILAITLYNKYFVRYNLLWLSAVSFYFILLGPLAYFYPLATFTSLLSVETINQSILTYWYTSGFITNLLRHDLTLIFEGLAAITIVSCLVPVQKIKVKISVD